MAVCQPGPPPPPGVHVLCGHVTQPIQWQVTPVPELAECGVCASLLRCATDGAGRAKLLQNGCRGPPAGMTKQAEPLGSWACACMRSSLEITKELQSA